MKISDKMKLAIARYFHNRNRQFVERRVDGEAFMYVKMTDKNATKWDKVADCREIEMHATKAGFSFTAAPGTFWFGKKSRVIECNEGNYLDGGVLKKKTK